MKKVDMSEKAILGRLKTVDQLRELSLSLMKAKEEHDQKEALVSRPKNPPKSTGTNRNRRQ